jgi:formyltetrahydrofolate deformylase
MSRRQSDSEVPDTATLLVSSPDQPGLVATLAQVLYGHGANILHLDQHTDTYEGQFFQRIHFDLGGLRTDRVALEHAISEAAERLQMSWRLSYRATIKRLAIFVSKYDHCLWELLLSHRAGDLPCAIPLIISNHPDLGPVAEQFGIDFHVFHMTKETKADQEKQQIALLRQHDIDVVALARYMQILSEDFISQLPSRIINIHHSFLPAFIGSRPYHQAHARGVKRIENELAFVWAKCSPGRGTRMRAVHRWAPPAIQRGA